MNNKIDKNFFKQIIVIFLVILAANYAIHICLGTFSQKAYQKYYHSLDKYLPEHNNDIINNAFTNYKPHIDTTNIPKTFKEYKSSDSKDKEPKPEHSSYEIINNIPCFYAYEYYIRKKQIQQLEPKIHKYFPYIKADLYPYKDIQLFYNKYGELIFIIKPKDSFVHYMYNTEGSLLEVKVENCTEYIIYNSNKQIHYTFGNFGETFEFNRYITYPEYLIKLNIFIFLTTLLFLLIFILFKLCKIYDFLPKVNNEYLDRFQYRNNYKNLFQYIYYKILKTKIHLWSHIIMLIGWASLVWLILLSLPFVDILGFFTLSCASILLLGIIIIESIFFRKFRIKWRFIYKNKIYNKIWHIGIIGYIVFVIIFFKNIIQLL